MKKFGIEDGLELKVTIFLLTMLIVVFVVCKKPDTVFQLKLNCKVYLCEKYSV